MKSLHVFCLFFYISLFQQYVLYGQKDYIRRPGTTNWWEVVVNKESVNVYSDMGCNNKIPGVQLKFKDQFHCTAKGNNSFEIHHKSSGKYYWVKSNDLLESEVCEQKNYISIKASIVTYAKEEVPENDYYDSPLSDKIIGSARWYYIYFVYSHYPANVPCEEADYVLLGKSYRFEYPSGEKSPQNILIGWFKTKDVLIWNTRIAFQPNLNSAATSQKKQKGIYATIWSDISSCRRYSDGNTADAQMKIADDSYLIEKNIPLTESTYRFPVTSRESDDGTKSVYEIAFAGKFDDPFSLSPPKDPISNGNFKARLSKVKIMFCVDATKTMCKYINNTLPASISGAATWLKKAYPSYKITWGLSVFRNKADVDNNRYDFIGATENISTFRSYANRIKCFSNSSELPEDMFRGTKKALDDFFDDSKDEVRITIVITDVKGENYLNDTPEVLGEKLAHKQSHLIVMNLGDDYEKELRHQVLTIIQNENAYSHIFSSVRDKNGAATYFYIDHPDKSNRNDYQGVYIKVNNQNYYQDILQQLIKKIIENLYIGVDSVVYNTQAKETSSDRGPQKIIYDYEIPDFPMIFNPEFRGLDLSNKKVGIKFVKGFVINSHKNLPQVQLFEPVILLSQEECYDLYRFSSELANCVRNNTDPNCGSEQIYKLITTHAGEKAMYLDIAAVTNHMPENIPLLSKLISEVNEHGTKWRDHYSQKALFDESDTIMQKADLIKSYFNDMARGKASFVIGDEKFRWIRLGDLP